MFELNQVLRLINRSFTPLYPHNVGRVVGVKDKVVTIEWISQHPTRQQHYNIGLFTNNFFFIPECVLLKLVFGTLE